MSEQSTSNTQPQSEKGKSLLVLLFTGSLSMFTAEVWAGSSTTWFLDVFGIFLTLPLYLFHLLFYYNVAHRFKRDRILHLYFWGMLFALYEAPLTKVLWAGYIGQEPIFGTLFGIAILEFLTLVFFWHPIFSFILPVLLLEAFLGAINPETTTVIPTSHLTVIRNTDRNKLLLIILVILVSPFLPNNSGYDFFNTTVAAVGSVIIIALLLSLIIKKDKPEITTTALILGKKGLLATCIYLLMLYILFSLLVLPERFPTSMISYLSIILFAAFMITLLKWNGPTKPHVNDKITTNVVISDPQDTISHDTSILLSPRFILSCFLLYILLTSAFLFTPTITMILSILNYLLLTGIGMILFPIAVIKMALRK